MPTSAVYYIAPSPPDPNPTQSLIQRLHDQYDPAPSSSWSLAHRLFREAPTNLASETTKAPSHRYLQILTLSHHAPLTHIAITGASSSKTESDEAPEKVANDSVTPIVSSAGCETVMSIPAGMPSDDFIHLMLTKFGPLWLQRQVLHVSHGVSYEVGAFRVRMGELKQAQVSKGTICEIESLDEGDWLGGEAVLRAFWEGLRLPGAKEIYHVPGMEDEMANIGRWLEIMRMRS